MLLVESHTIGLIRIDARVRTGNKSTTDGDLRGETNNCASDVGVQERSDSDVDVTRVRRQERPEDEEDLAGAVGGSVTA